MTLKGGTIIWAKTDRRYWPAIILPENSINKPTRKQYLWVFWFGDYRMSEIRVSCILAFPDLFKTKSSSYFKDVGSRWSTGVYESIKAYGDPLTVDWNNETLLNWAINGFKDAPTVNEKSLPDFVLEKLHTLLNTKINSPLKSVKNEASILKTNGKNKTCLGCYSSNVIDIHPLFLGNVCKHCKDKVLTTIFLIGDDNINFCCMICGNFGEMIVCSVRICGRSYCYRCLDNFYSVKKRKMWMKKEFWMCFMCITNESKEDLIQRRENWREEIDKIYIVKHHPIPKMPLIRRPIRVLSLFDGIASGLAALKKNNISVEAYYASEIDINAIDVSQKAYPNEIVHFGTITKVTEVTLESIIPIDLLIGGSPCNDLSLANPERKGIFDPEGTGVYYFDYYRILMILKEINKQPFFWLFENVASMCAESRDMINRCFECEAVKINSAWVSPQNRERLFWGNCPSLKMNFRADGPKLQEYLEQGRTAVVEKIATVTTSSNSLLQGAAMKHPVLNINNEPEKLTLNEIEKVFGFKPDYTKVNNFSNRKRLGLIGRAWSVQVATMLLHFLKYYYKVNYE